MIHYVYHIISSAKDLLYIGRSMKPKERLRCFRRRSGLRDAVLSRVVPYATFEAAQAAEIAAIKRHSPPYNKKLISSRGALGVKMPPYPDSARKRLSEVGKGRKFSTEHRAALAALRKHKRTDQHKANISLSKRGLPCAYIS